MEVECPGVGIESVDQKKMFSEFKQFNTNELQGGGSKLLLPVYISCYCVCCLYTKHSQEVRISVCGYPDESYTCIRLFLVVVCGYFLWLF